jgi:hypothetical protein
MKASPLTRKTANLSESIHHRLNVYALAASAAGVGILATGQRAEAKIVYTPANIKIVQNGGLITFDLNHDGIPDFGLSNKFTSFSSNKLWTLRAVQARQANEIREGLPCYEEELCAAALPKGAKIGLKGQFQQDPRSGLLMIQLAICDSCSNNGPWLNVKQAYLGLKFVIKAKTHFGWARVQLSHTSGSIHATLTGYAYESIPGKPIIAGATKGPDDAEPTASFSSHTPEPATLGALALGTPGLSIWRRKEPAAATSDRN